MKRGAVLVGIFSVAALGVALATCRRDETSDALTTTHAAPTATPPKAHRTRNPKADDAPTNAAQDEPPRAAGAKAVEPDFSTIHGLLPFDPSSDIRGGRPLNIFFREGRGVTARFLRGGAPLAGVAAFTSKSGDDGRIAFHLMLGFRGFVIARTPDGVEIALTPPQDDDDAPFDFGDVRVEPAGTITGVVVDENGAPARSAWVEVRSTELDCRAICESRTDDGGRFAARGIGPYRYEVVAQNGGRAAREVAVTSGAELRLVLRKTFETTIRLLGPDGAAPEWPCEATCELRRPGAAKDASLHESIRGDRDAAVALVEAGTYEIDVRALTQSRAFTGHVAAIDLAPDHENIVEVRLVEAK